MAATDDEIVRRFVLRARRVQSHSLVQDLDNLRHFARGELQGHLDLSGQMLVTRRLPADEEVFESLVARLRPLTLSPPLKLWPSN